MLHRVLVFLAYFCAAVRAEEKFGPYAEPDFPVLTSTVDFTDWEKLGFPKDNIAVRGLIIKLPHDLYVCFDQDLLRVAGIWQGEPGGKFLTFTTIPAISYNQENKKSEGGQKDLPKPIGKPLMATGLMPGVFPKPPDQVMEGDFADPRPPGPDPTEPGRGALPDGWPHWFNWHVWSGRIDLTVAHGDALLLQQFSSALVEGKPVVRRLLFAPRDASQLSIATGNLADGKDGVPRRPEVIALQAGASRNLYYTEGPLPPPETLKTAGFLPPRWENRSFFQSVKVKVTRRVDHGSFVVEEIPLPIPNPWKRNVRPSGICSVKEDGVEMLGVCTIDGDVWTVTGAGSLNGEVEWRRIAAGLHEPQSICRRLGSFYVFTSVLFVNSLYKS